MYSYNVLTQFYLASELMPKTNSFEKNGKTRILVQQPNLTAFTKCFVFWTNINK